jgi:rhodanese-related sulfurtransferase
VAKYSKGFLKLVEDARTRVPEISPTEVLRRINRREFLYLIDVREEHEWVKARIPRARHLGKGVIERDIENRLPDHRAKIVLYCGGGFRSALAADNIQKMGYTNAISMDGGYKGWVAAGHAIEPPESATGLESRASTRSPNAP